MNSVDPEIEAITAVATALTGLDVDTQARVLNWALSRFGHNQHDDQPHAQMQNPVVDRDKAEPQETAVVGALKYDDFVDLYDACNPKNGPQRALVGAFWFQVVQGLSGFVSQDVNNQLKHMGHGISNITSTLTSLQKQQPALIRQMNKSGKSTQARKTYKLTEEGIRAVKRMMPGVPQ